MAVEAGLTYEAVVVSASYILNEKAGRSDLFMSYKTGDGMVDCTWWITENTIDRLTKNLKECFGITDEQLEDVEFLRTGLLKFITGKNVSIVTKLKKDSNGNVYTDAKGKTYVTVEWMNPSRAGKAVTSEAFNKMATLFGAVTSRPHGNNEPPPVQWAGEESEDVPF